jgi:hypothetical protein
MSRPSDPDFLRARLGIGDLADAARSDRIVLLADEMG